MANPTITVIRNQFGREWREAIPLRDYDPKKHVMAPEAVEDEAGEAFASAAKSKTSRKKTKKAEPQTKEAPVEPDMFDELLAGDEAQV